MPHQGAENGDRGTENSSIPQNPSTQSSAQAPPGGPLPAPNVHVHGALPAGQLPPQLQQAFAQFQVVNQALAAQLASINANHGLPAMAPSVVPVQPTIPHPVFTPQQFQPFVQQQHVQNYQQAAVPGIQLGIGVPPQQVNQQTHHGPPNPNLQRNHLGTASAMPGNTVTRENIGPNGERWQVIIQSQHVNMTPPQMTQNHTDPPVRLQSANGTGSLRSSPGPSGPLQQNQAPSMALTQLRSTLASISTTVDLRHPVPESAFSQAQESLRNISELSEQSRSELSTGIQDLAHRAAHLRVSLQNQSNRAAQQRMAAQRDRHGTDSTSVYVLSSPSGPQALLVSPSGLFSAPWQVPAHGASSAQPNFQLQPQSLPVQNQVVNLNDRVNGQVPFVGVNQALPGQQPVLQQVNPAQLAQVQQEQGANQARDLLRILLPLGGHLWLLIRLFGFVYFFTAGANLSRTILLGLVACIVFIAQTGIFRPAVQGIWEPIRRHAEGLVPLAGNERPNPRGAPAPANNNTDAAGMVTSNRAITPQEAAERLLQERERQDVNFMRQAFRRIERAIALFAASLIPGVGERHIRAREQAEAARQAQAREREERVRMEEEEVRRGQQQSENTPANEQGAANATRASGITSSASAPASGSDTSPPPLIEV